ncbi:acyltransferase [Salmonella enterica subsp. diarizonae]|nr:acyltransferase [Salmonella enterica subsp. diarizonae]EDQ3623294.1 acyltransferase [Salmonella enterica subsp. diarizonae]
MTRTLRFETLNGLRGICALLIACSHFPAAFLGDQWVLFRHAFVFTNLFFGLSGFILLAVYRERLRTPRHLADFSRKRVKRLVPVHLITTLLILLVPFAAWLLQSLIDSLMPGRSPGGLPALPLDVRSLLVHVFLLQGFGLLPQLVYNFPAWSLGAIFYCSLLLGGLLCFTRRIRIVMYGVICLGAVVVLLRDAPHYLTSSWDYGIFRALSCFFLGALAAEVRCHYRTLSPRLAHWLPLLQTLTLMLVLLLATAVQTDSLMTFALLPALTLFLWVFSYDGTDYARALQLPVFRWLSERAYSIFMNQALLLFLGAEMQRSSALLALSPFSSRVAGTFALALYLVLLLLLSDWTWRNIEQRFNGRNVREGVKGN